MARVSRQHERIKINFLRGEIGFLAYAVKERIRDRQHALCRLLHGSESLTQPTTEGMAQPNAFSL